MASSTHFLFSAGVAAALGTVPSAQGQVDQLGSDTVLGSAESSMLEVGPNVGSQPKPLLPPPAKVEPVQGEPAPPAAPEKSRFHLALGMDFTTAYFGRGIYAEDSGLIVQPFADASLEVFRLEGATISLTMGTWNSFHGEATGAATTDDFTRNWYESDLYAGLGVAFGKWSLETRYYFDTSPSGAFETIQELYFSAAYDDSELLGAWSLKPTTIVAFETGSAAADGGRPGTYLELGVSPGFSFETCGVKDVELKFPVTVGLSLSNYYEGTQGQNDLFGYVSVGADLSVPLNLDRSWGGWKLHAGVQGLFLGDAASTLNGGDNAEAIGTIGVAVEF